MPGILGLLTGGLFGGGGKQGGGGLLGGLGNMIGSATSIIPNMVNMGIAAAKNKKADAMSPGLYNPLQVDLLQEIKAKKKALETGTAYAGAQRQLGQQTAQAMRTAGNLSGGDVGMMMSALKGITRQGGVNQNALFDQMSNEGVQLSNLLNNLTQNMANRQYQISMADKLQKKAEAQQALKESTQGLRTSLSLGLNKMDIPSIMSNPLAGVTANAPATVPTAAGTNYADMLQKAQFTPGGGAMGDINYENMLQKAQFTPGGGAMGDINYENMLQKAQFNPANYYTPGQ